MTDQFSAPTSQFFIAPEQYAVDPPPNLVPNVIAGLVASGGIIVGSIGPWLTFMSLSRGAMDGDGIFTLILGIAAATALFGVLNMSRGAAKSRWMTRLASGAVIAAVITFLIAVSDANDVSSHKAEFLGRTLSAEIGWGLWLVLIASVALAVTATVVERQARKLL
jgi:hypothetical protein